MNIPQNIIVHHSVTPRDLSADKSEQSFNNTHKERFKDPKTGVNNYQSRSGWYIGYHYVIFGDGEVRKYRDHDEVGVHCSQENMNFRSIGVCLVGNFDEEIPSEAQKTALTTLVTRLRENLAIPHGNIFPHRKFAPKSCWGNKMPDDVNEFLVPMGHWSDPSMKWAEEHKFITGRKDPNGAVTWGELVVVLHRVVRTVLQWVRDENT